MWIQKRDSPQGDDSPSKWSPVLLPKDWGHWQEGRHRLYPTSEASLLRRVIAPFLVAFKSKMVAMRPMAIERILHAT